MPALVVDAEFGWVLVVMALTAFHVILQGFPVGRIRGKLFTKEYFSQHFPGLKEPPSGGYPDMGNGRYSEKLTLEQWTTFNNYQRAHYNYVEGIASVLILELASGLFFPRLTFILGVSYLVGRQLYSSGYRSRGATGRLVGAIIVDVALVVLLGSALFGGWKFAGGIAGLRKLFS